MGEIKQVITGNCKRLVISGLVEAVVSVIHMRMKHILVVYPNTLGINLRTDFLPRAECIINACHRSIFNPDVRAPELV